MIAFILILELKICIIGWYLQRVHKDLELWIKQHDDIEVYVSYNNKFNSFDYPAMYENVYVSGSSPKIHYKK